MRFDINDFLLTFLIEENKYAKRNKITNETPRWINRTHHANSVKTVTPPKTPSKTTNNNKEKAIDDCADFLPKNLTEITLIIIIKIPIEAPETLCPHSMAV